MKDFILLISAFVLLWVTIFVLDKRQENKPKEKPPIEWRV